MQTLDYFLLVAAGIGAGFINVVAGGGSLITLPLMIFMGLPPTIANGTNRVALAAQNIVAVSNFKKNKYAPGKYGLILGFFALAGAIIGASIAIDIPEKLFNRILSFVMIVVVVLIITSPKYETFTSERLSSKHNIIGYIAFFFIGIYGGFLHAGIGFIIILALVKINRFNLVKTNSIKVAVALIYTLTALIVFIVEDKVDWKAGLILSIGNATGGWLGSTFTVKKGDVWIKRILVVAICGMAAKLWMI